MVGASCLAGLLNFGIFMSIGRDLVLNEQSNEERTDPALLGEKRLDGEHDGEHELCERQEREANHRGV